jgi:hypothetical protein
MTADEILKTGARLGFTGGGDCHEGRVGFSAEDASGQGVTPHTFAAVLLYRCGMTAALMPTLDRLPLVQAIRNRRTYATTGARILLEFSVSGVPMGGVGQAQVATCSAVVHAVEPLRDIEIVKDGEVVSTHPGSGRDMTFSWCDPDPPTREHSYYLRVVQQDGEMAWSSPVWIGPRTDG